MPPLPPTRWPIPKLSIRIDDLAHDGAAIFLAAVDPTKVLEYAVKASFEWLYHSLDKAPTSVESLLLVLRPMPGVAYTFGSQSHKEIHFSLNHIKNCENRAKDEITGVLVHEVVHCYQYNGLGSAPSGLIEGIADYVRMNCSLSPPHWSKSLPPKKTDSWDSGYERMAFFLCWIERRYGDGTVRELNELLKDNEYSKKMWKQLTGRKIKKLWAFYCEEAGGDDDDDLVVVGKEDVH